MKFTAAVITVSDKASRGERIDTSGPALCTMLEQAGYEVVHHKIVPDEPELLKQELLLCTDAKQVSLVFTTGGTGFSPRDNTPEVTLEVAEREVRGIPELMRAESMKITKRGCLSRSAAGLRGKSLIVNLPGSEKAARENLSFILDVLPHGLEILSGAGSADCGGATANIKSVCVSEKKGEQKHPVEQIHLLPNHGVVGDAHAGNWHRQVSLLAAESVEKVQKNISFPLLPGAFAENILTEGICLYKLPVGTRLRVGTAICEVTQIGKECHSDCAIRQAAGDCVMPREGIFVKVLQEGFVNSSDTLAVLFLPEQ